MAVIAGAPLPLPLPLPLPALKREQPPELCSRGLFCVLCVWLRGQDLNLRPSGYEPDELPGCSTPREMYVCGPERDRDWEKSLVFPVPCCVDGLRGSRLDVLCRPGGARLSRVLRRSTIGAEEFNGRVRNGIGLGLLAMATGPAKHT